MSPGSRSGCRSMSQLHRTKANTQWNSLMVKQDTRRQWIFLDKVGLSLANTTCAWALHCGRVGASTAGRCYSPVTHWVVGSLCVPSSLAVFVGTVQFVFPNLCSKVINYEWLFPIPNTRLQFAY